MKHSRFLLPGVLLILMFFGAFDKKGPDSVKPGYIPPSPQRPGNADEGFKYLTTGDFIRSGFPYDFFVFANGKGHNYLQRSGKNATVEHGYNVIRNEDSLDIVIPTCMQCHAEVFEGKLYPGLGNASADFSYISQRTKMLGMLRQWKNTAPQKYKAVSALLTALTTVNPRIETEVFGVNPADKLAAVLVAHRNPKTLVWSDSPLLAVPDVVIPTDVPAWWLLKKKNAMFYTGFGRGDFGKFLMLSNILTVADTNEARDVNSHFGDVLAYIRSLSPPPYPGEIDQAIATRGKIIFTEHCSGCHGTYDTGWSYPNLLIPGSVIRTDSMLYISNQQSKTFIDWFNNSWFAQAPYPAQLVPGNGYVAPPLDGIWITAPYLHNGSVPTLEGVLNSKIRPRYWRRTPDSLEYDYEHVGWKYDLLNAPDGKKAYNTTLPGYGNYGHYFGDKLSANERKAVIEYLKTL